jgi:flavorubredoxin
LTYVNTRPAPTPKIGPSFERDFQYKPIVDFDAHLPTMAAFHKRYMASNRACRWWARRTRALDTSMIAPQHGLPIDGANVARFIDWIENPQCGVDLLPESDAVFA